MRGSRTPGILFSVYIRQTRVREVEAAVFVDAVDVGGSGDVECADADEGEVVEVEEPGDERELVFGNSGAGLQEAPFGAVLVGPRSPALVSVVLLVVGLVVGGVALVLDAGT
jgi:hypothetical protein